jgi:SH3-like domain-containing protein
VRSASLIVLLLGLTLCGVAVAADAPVPRFSSLRYERVNVRVGPGPNFPIEWVFVRRAMPVEVVEEYETWRKIRDWQGTEGWVRENSLAPRRTALVTGSVRLLYRNQGDPSEAVAQVEPGAIGQLLSCDSVWCRLDFAGKRGYLKQGEFWGTYPNETVR